MKQYGLKVALGSEFIKALNLELPNEIIQEVVLTAKPTGWVTLEVKTIPHSEKAEGILSGIKKFVLTHLTPNAL